MNKLLAVLLIASTAAVAGPMEPTVDQCSLAQTSYVKNLDYTDEAIVGYTCLLSYPNSVTVDTVDTNRAAMPHTYVYNIKD